MQQKYIVVETPSENEVMIVFSGILEHSSVSPGWKAISAGFITFETIEDYVIIKCSGESMSLNIKSRPETDQKLAMKQFFEYPQD